MCTNFSSLALGFGLKYGVEIKSCDYFAWDECGKILKFKIEFFYFLFYLLHYQKYLEQCKLKINIRLLTYFLSEMIGLWIGTCLSLRWRYQTCWWDDNERDAVIFSNYLRKMRVYWKKKKRISWKKKWGIECIIMQRGGEN